MAANLVEQSLKEVEDSKREVELDLQTFKIPNVVDSFVRWSFYFRCLLSIPLTFIALAEQELMSAIASVHRHLKHVTEDGATLYLLY